MLAVCAQVGLRREFYDLSTWPAESLAIMTPPAIAATRRGRQGAHAAGSPSPPPTTDAAPPAGGLGGQLQQAQQAQPTLVAARPAAGGRIDGWSAQDVEAMQQLRDRLHRMLQDEAQMTLMS